jgi:hypothetical protein
MAVRLAPISGSTSLKAPSRPTCATRMLFGYSEVCD